MKIEIVKVENIVNTEIIELKEERQIVSRKTKYDVFYTVTMEDKETLHFFPIKGILQLNEKLTIPQIREKIKEDILIIE